MSLKRIHRITGLVLVLIMLVISVTGTLLLWKREYLWLTIPEARGELLLSPVELDRALSRMQTFYATDELTFVQLGSENLSLHRAYLKNKRYAWHDHHGVQLAVWRGSERFEDWLLDLHHRFLLGNTIGLNIAGFGGLLLIPLLLIGFWLWWPRRKLLKLGVLPSTREHGVWMRSHSNLGALAGIPILLVGLTGVILVYPMEARTLLLDGFQSSAPRSEQEIVLAAQPSLKGALLLAQQRFPNSRPRWVSLPSSGHNNFSVGLQQSDAWNRMGNSSLAFSANGSVAINNAQNHSRWKRVFDFSYPFHAAKFNWPLRLLFSVIGLAFATLCLFGAASYLKRK